jgi:hypothetical protein
LLAEECFDQIADEVLGADLSLKEVLYEICRSPAKKNRLLYCLQAISPQRHKMNSNPFIHQEHHQNIPRHHAN